MSFVFTPAPPVSVPVLGSEARFPVHRIYCVGRNYEEHAKEMGFTGREPPFFFLKPTDALVVVGGLVMVLDPIFQGLAVALMSGAIVATLLTMVVVPLLYWQLNRSNTHV